MVWRGYGGLRNGVLGYWVSKPGIDVTTAGPGSFLLDTSSIALQTVFKGDTSMAVNPPANGTYSKTVAVPSQYAPFSRLYAVGTAYRSFNGAVSFDPFYQYPECWWNIYVGGGYVYLNMGVITGHGPSDVVDWRVAWSVLRGQY